MFVPKLELVNFCFNLEATLATMRSLGKIAMAMPVVRRTSYRWNHFRNVETRYYLKHFFVLEIFRFKIDC